MKLIGIKLDEKAVVFGGICGAISHIISSPILGNLYGFEKGAFFGQLLGSALIAIAFHVITEKKHGKWVAAIIAIVSFCATYYGGLTVYAKEIIDSYIHKTDANYFVGYLIVYGFQLSVLNILSNEFVTNRMTVS